MSVEGSGTCEIGVVPLPAARTNQLPVNADEESGLATDPKCEAVPVVGNTPNGPVGFRRVVASSVAVPWSRYPSVTDSINRLFEDRKVTPMRSCSA